jgi:6-methylsalicylate decarboxylase
MSGSDGRRIDVHHHIFPTPFLAAARSLGKLDFAVNGQRQLLAWKRDDSLAAMDRSGIRTAIVSVSTPGVWWGDNDARRLARECNEFAAEMVRDVPGRYGFFASMPMPDVDGTLAEIAYALDVLQATGIVFMTNFAGRWPGEPDFGEVFRELNRRKATVYFHPTVADCCRNLIPDVAPPMIEFPVDTTRAITSLLCGGTLSACPDVRWIFSHGGGALPVLAERIAQQIRGVLTERVPNGALAEFARLYFDIALATNAPMLAALIRFAPLDHIVFGTDYPFGDPEVPARGLRAFGLSEAELTAIEVDNPARLLRFSPASAAEK